MKKIGQIFLVVSFLGIIFTVPVLTKLEPHQDISKFEKRKLAAAPRMTKEGFITGEYFSKWESYLADHMVERDTWITKYMFFQMNILKKHKINNVVIGKDGFLLKFNPYEKKINYDKYRNVVEKMVEDISTLNQHVENNGGKFYFVGVPNQESFHKDKYPKYFNNRAEYFEKNEQYMFETLREYGINSVNMNSVFLKHKDENLYFKTDHHYTFRGAYLTYQEIVKRLFMDKAVKQMSLKEDDFKWKELPNPFSGSRNEQLYYLYPSKDKLEIAFQKQKVAFEKIVRHKVPYGEEVQAEKDPIIYNIGTDPTMRLSYLMYMGGNHAEIVMKTHRKELPNLLIFGDSFTNPLEPLLSYHFNETRILDLRYYKKMSVFEYISKYKPDVVIMLRNDTHYTNMEEGNGDLFRKYKELYNK